MAQQFLKAEDYSRTKFGRFSTYCLNNTSDALKLVEVKYHKHLTEEFYNLSFMFMDYEFSITHATSIVDGLKQGLVKLEEFFSDVRAREEELDKLIT